MRSLPLCTLLGGPIVRVSFFVILVPHEGHGVFVNICVELTVLRGFTFAEIAVVQVIIIDSGFYTNKCVFTTTGS